MSEPVAPSTFDRLLQSLRAIIRAEFPQFTYAGIYEYAIQSSSGATVSCDPVDTTVPLPSLANVELRPSILGEAVTSPILSGSRCLVAFVNNDPTRPTILSISNPPASAAITAGLQVATEHVATIEGVCVLLHNVLLGIGGVALPPALLGSGIVAGIINAALTAAAAPAPPGLPAQSTAAAAAATSMLSAPGNSSTLYATTIAAVSTKTPDVSGLFPSLGAANVKTG